MPARLNAGQFAELHGRLGLYGGFTVDPRTAAPSTSGIAVATERNELRIPAADTSPERLHAYHADAGNQERFDRGASFGGWRDDVSGDDFLDTPTVYPDSPAGNSRARRHMLKADQIAAYDIGRDRTLLNPFHPENQSLDVVNSDFSQDQQEAWSAMPRRITSGPSTGMEELKGRKNQSFS